MHSPREKGAAAVPVQSPKDTTGQHPPPASGWSPSYHLATETEESTATPEDSRAAFTPQAVTTNSFLHAPLLNDFNFCGVIIYSLAFFFYICMELRELQVMPN